MSKFSVPITVLKAAVIIGSGSASYEIIQHLTKKLFVILIPPWAQNKCQPIAIRDVIKYLVGTLETPETVGKQLVSVMETLEKIRAEKAVIVLNIRLHSSIYNCHKNLQL